MRTRGSIRLLVGVAVAGVSTVLLAGCSHETTAPEGRAEPAAQEVGVVLAARHSQPVFEQVVGSVTARTKPVVSAKISGTIQSLGADVGDRVRSGQLLAEIDAREIQARLDQALPQLESARQSAARIRELVQAKAVSQQQDDDAVARVKQMEAVVTEARTMLSYAKVVSPIDGVVRARRVDVGDLAFPGKALFELEGLEEFRFDAGIPESLTGRIHKGDRARIRIDATGADVTGSLAEISPASDPSSRTFLVRYDLDTSAALVSGQFGRLLLPVGESKELTVPRSALVRRGQLEMVFVLDGERARLRLVRSGRSEGDKVAILSGLSDGEKVLSGNAELLEDGQRVTVQP